MALLCVHSDKSLRLISNRKSLLRTRSHVNSHSVDYYYYNSFVSTHIHCKNTRTYAQHDRPTLC